MKQIRKYKYYKFYLTFVAVCIGALSEPVIAVAYSYLGNLYDKSNVSDLSKTILPCLMLTILGLFFGALSGFIKVYASNKASNLLQIDIFSNILKESIQEYRKKTSGEYINLLTKKCDIWQINYYNNFLDSLMNIIQILIMAVILTMIHYSMFILIFVFLIPLFFNNIVFPQKIQKEFSKYLDSDSVFITFIKDCLTGFETIKVHVSENVFYKKSVEILETSRIKKNKAEQLGELSGFIANTGVTLSQFAGTFFGIYLMKSQQITFSEFLIVFQLSTRLYEPFVGLINNLIGMKSTHQILVDLNTILANSQKNKAHNSGKKTIETIKSITLNDVSFQYQNHIIFDHINITFHPGSYLVIGESGSGKTTLIDMLLKNIDTYTGNIFYNNLDSRTIDSKHIYNKVAYMNQNSYLFNMSIKENIDLHNTKTNNEIESFIKKHHMEKIIMNRKNGVNDILKEENNKVSGGEKARVVYMRTILDDDKDVIIFDEVLSSLDKENAILIEQAILEIKNKIVIHIAHHTNDELYEKYSHIIKIEDKKIIQLR